MVTLIVAFTHCDIISSNHQISQSHNHEKSCNNKHHYYEIHHSIMMRYNDHNLKILKNENYQGRYPGSHL